MIDKARVGLLRERLRRMPPGQVFGGDDGPTARYLEGAGFSPAMINRLFRPFLGGIFLDRELLASSRMFRFVFRMFAAGAVATPRLGMGAIPQQRCGPLPKERIHLRARVTQVDPGATCLYFDAPAAPVKDPILVPNGAGAGAGPINNLHVASQVNPHCAPAGRALISVTVVGRTQDTPETETRVRRQLREWFGAAAEEWRLLRRYLIPKALPGQRPGVLEPAERPVRTAAGLYLCGDHVDQASIQGAMVSGRRAAEAVLEDRGRARH